ncbi:MAG: YggS family pyridoxal phosphate-dependent enzyme [Candidatus Omnitrophota bacterium]
MIKENITQIKELISLVCSRIDKDPEAITIVAISKGRAIDQIGQVLESGIINIGENRVQEAIVKYNELQALNSRFPTIKWHMVGNLQTNKVKEAVRIFDLIHSVDSLRLAKEIDKYAGRMNKTQDILVEVNTSGEASKSGLKPDEAISVIKEIARLENLNIKGLMTIAPIVENPEKARPYFRCLKELNDEINNLQPAICRLQVLSMGMTDDYLVAIQEGSNMVRLGRVIFEG